MSETRPQGGVAIVGMAGRFPGADDVASFWRNIKAGVDSITRFSPDELEIPQPESEQDTPFVCARGILNDIDKFDAKFWDYLPREAEVMDPQHRVFLETCWQAVENAGYDPSRYDGSVGVFGGCYMDTYILHNLCSDEKFRQELIQSIQVGSLQTELGNDKDYLASRVAFKMGLRGPALTLQTACSTSLVAVSMAAQSLETHGCDVALAGGVTIILPQHKGYLYKEGGMLSPDGHCRPFDATAAGTVFSHGAAVLLLKRVEDAIAEGDTIYAVIRGYAINNDGAAKVSYTAPSVEGQSEVIAQALAMSGISSRTIGYVEAHGTATPLGDPIEVAGLSRAYRHGAADTQYCALGSVKANLGHLDVASGATGLIKTAMALYDRVLPPQIHFEHPNSDLNLESSPFYVNTELSPWVADSHPRRAGISSFGVGGTNAHVVLEEAPPARPVTKINRTEQLLLLSARSAEALTAQAVGLAAHFESHPKVSLSDAAYTLQVGRKAFEYRHAVVATSPEEAAKKLRRQIDVNAIEISSPQIVFLFPGQGAQCPGMARGLYEAEQVFRDTIDTIAEALMPPELLGMDLRRLLLWSEHDSPLSEDVVADHLSETALAQPAIFAMEMALARLLESWGIKPDCLVGHSVGEVAVACLAGVFPMEAAARLVCRRGILMQSMPPGQMLAVRLAAQDMEGFLKGSLTMASINGPTNTVVSGSTEHIAALQRELEEKGIASAPLKTSHGFHSSMMAGAQAPLVSTVGRMKRRKADIEIISTLTGKVAAPGELAAAEYWGQQLLSPVRFADAVMAAAAPSNRVLIEVGPGQTLSNLSRQCLREEGARPVISCLGNYRGPDTDITNIMSALGDLWTHGIEADWHAVHGGQRRRIPLPTYPFARDRHWVEAKSKNSTDPKGVPTAIKVQEQEDGEVEELIQKQLDVIAAQLEAIRRS